MYATNEIARHTQQSVVRTVIVVDETFGITIIAIIEMNMTVVQILPGSKAFDRIFPFL